MNEKKKERNLDLLYRHRELLDKTRVGIAASFDKYLLTLSSGSLYLSVLFTNSLEKRPLFKIELLNAGWFLLVASIAAMLISIYFSVKAHEEAMDEIDNMIDDLNEDREPRSSSDNCASKIVSLFEVFGGIAFVFGTVLLAYFYCSNL